MHPYSDFQCIKFQGNQIMPLCFIATFTPLQKEEKKHSYNILCVFFNISINPVSAVVFCQSYT